MAVKTVFFLYLFCLWLQVQAQQGVVLRDISDLPSKEKWCFGQTVTLLCTHPDPFENSVKYISQAISFIENGEVLNFGEPATSRRFTLTRVNSTASALSFTVTEEYHTNEIYCSCFLALADLSGSEESDQLRMNTKTGPPTIMSTPDSTSGLLKWSPSPSCGTYSYEYSFTLTWVRMEDGSTDTDSTENNEYDFTGRPEGNYTVSLKTRVTNFNLNESEPVIGEFNLTNSEQFTSLEPPPPVCIVCIAVPPGVVIPLLCLLILIVLIVLMYYLCRNRQKRVSHSHSADPVPTLQEYSEAPFKKQEAEDAELGQTRQELDKKQETENQVQYADIDFSHQRPMAPPPLETVVYTVSLQQFQKSRKNRPIPPLPPVKTEEEEEEEKQLAQEAAEITADFKAQVVAILQASKLVFHSLDPEEPVVGTYQKKTFVASFVHAPGGKEILSSEVEAIIKARELQSTDKGFLMATTDSISGPWLEYLEKHNCHFIGLSRKGGVKKEMLLSKLSFCFPESSSF